MSSLWPLFDRFPRLAELPRVALRTEVTPVEQVDERLWVKRDDLTANPVGGNKVRALEFLLGPYAPGSRVITGGSRGSTHVLSTIVHARALGIDIEAGSWPQEMNEVARAVDARLDREAHRRRFRGPVSTALWLTWRVWRGDNVIPAGGTSPLGIVGHVNAAFELAAQVREGKLPKPRRVVVPLGTGGTMAGLALGFRLAGLDTTVVGARVVPRIIGRTGRVRHLMRVTLDFIERVEGNELSVPGEIDIEVAHRVYGGAYGRALRGAPGTLPSGTPLDATYSGKAFVAAVEAARVSDTLFWLTFDSRWMNQ